MRTNEQIVLYVGEQHGFVFQRGRNDLALFAALGTALAEIQAFEMSIENHLQVLSHKASAEDLAPSKNPEQFYSQTLGMLIKEFQKFLPDTGIAELLENVRKKRNYLVHKILRAYQWPLMSDEDYVRAITEIEEIRAFIEHANVEVSRYLANHSLIGLVVVSIDRKTGEVKQIV